MKHVIGLPIKDNGKENGNVIQGIYIYCICIDGGCR